MTNTPIQLVVSDLDGTLLDSDCYISPGAMDAIAALEARGIGFTIASGRGYFLMMPLVRRLQLRLPAIFSGGALTLNPDGSVVDLARPVAMADALSLLHYGRSHGLGISFHEPDGVYAERGQNGWERGSSHNWLPEEPERIDPYHFVPDLLDGRNHPPLRVDLFGPADLVRAAAAELPALYPHLQVMAVVGHLEITASGVNKGSAITCLAGILGLPVESVVVIGDDINDLSMFAVAGRAIAMGNAIPALKALASTVAPSCDQGGFAWAMQRVVEGKV